LKLRKVSVLDTESGELLDFEEAEERLREKVTQVITRIITSKLNEDWIKTD
jgi:hypothetical protein